MAVAPLIAMKSTKCESLEAVGRELDRRAHTYVNDVDRSRSGENRVYRVRHEDARAAPLEVALDRRMGELNTKRAIRKDAVKAMGFVVSTNDALDDETAHAFLKDSLQWFGRRYGYENLLAAAEHFDEGTPHMHLWIAPVTRSEDGYDRLCAKELFAPDKRRKSPETGKWEVTEQGTMSQLQQDFWREVASRYGYEKPLDRAKRAKGYRSLEAFKNHEGVTRELKAEVSALEQERDEAKAEQVENRAKLRGLQGKVAETQALAADMSERLSEKTAALAEIQAKIGDFSEKEKAARQRLESLRQREGAERAAVAELDRAIEQARAQPARETVSEGVRTLWKGRGAGSREEGLEREIEGLRGRVSELERANQGARERLACLDGRVRGLRDRLQGIRGRFDDLGRRVRELVSGLLRVPDTLSDLALDMAEDAGKTVYNPNSLSEICAQATAAAQAYNEGRYERGEVPEPRRTWSR